jgi:hypothetical protein
MQAGCSHWLSHADPFRNMFWLQRLQEGAGISLRSLEQVELRTPLWSGERDMALFNRESRFFGETDV